MFRGCGGCWRVERSRCQVFVNENLLTAGLRSNGPAPMREKLSAFVITYNRPALLEACLRAVSFVDELIVVDKSSTDETASVAARYTDRVVVVPWSPTVEETRAFALSLCRHDQILGLDDDEILSPESR